MSTVGLVVLLAAVLAVGAVAALLRRAARVPGAAGRPDERSSSVGSDVPGSDLSSSDAPAPEAPGTDLAGVLAGLGVRPGEADLTVVQFSTAFCGPCRTTRARLQQLRTTRPGLAYVHVDAESHLDAVRALGVRRTPTLFYLRRDGSLVGRSSGAPRPEELTALVDAHTGAPR